MQRTIEAEEQTLHGGDHPPNLSIATSFQKHIYGMREGRHICNVKLHITRLLLKVVVSSERIFNVVDGMHNISKLLATKIIFLLTE